MLANRLEKTNIKPDPCNSFIQLKYNGHRCLITKRDGQVSAYSKNGKSIPGVPHVLAKIQIEEGQIRDGELYRHGWTLQRIASAAKKYQKDSLQLKFQCYDMVSQDSYVNRLEQLTEEYKQGLYGDGVILCATKRLDAIPDLYKTFVKAKENGYEGLMLRLGDQPYDAGRRSNALLKIKKFGDEGYIDDEFVVIDIVPSKNNWGILICQLPNGGTFRCSAPGNVPKKTETLRNKHKYIGKKVKVEFPEYTNDDIPFQPVALEWFVDL